MIKPTFVIFKSAEPLIYDGPRSNSDYLFSSYRVHYDIVQNRKYFSDPEFGSKVHDSALPLFYEHFKKQKNNTIRRPISANDTKMQEHYIIHWGTRHCSTSWASAALDARFRASGSIDWFSLARKSLKSKSMPLHMKSHWSLRNWHIPNDSSPMSTLWLLSPSLC